MDTKTRFAALLTGVVLLLGLSGPSPAAAQSNEATIEASIFRGTAGYARGVSARTLVGVELGFGFPQIDRTVVPERNEETGGPDFEEYLHLALFVRHRADPRFEIDTGVRAAVGDLWHCTSSDCLPAIFSGAYVQPMVGWERVKVGARLTAGWISESQEGGPESNTFVVGVAPFLIRATLPF